MVENTFLICTRGTVATADALHASFHRFESCRVHQFMKDVITAPDWLVERMDKLSKMTPPTLEEVQQQFEASARQRRILEDIPKVSREEFSKMLFQRS